MEDERGARAGGGRQMTRGKNLFRMSHKNFGLVDPRKQKTALIDVLELLLCVDGTIVCWGGLVKSRLQ